MTTTDSTTHRHGGHSEAPEHRDARNGGGSQPPGLRERKAQRTRTEIIDAAVKLCLSVGYERTTVEMVAGEADVSARTFSRYFASKDAVFLAVMDPVADHVVLELSCQPSLIGPLEAMRAAHVAVFTRVAECPYGRLSADQVAVMLRVVNSSETLRKKAVEYRHPPTMQILADRMGVGPDDRKLQLAVALFSLTLVGACADLVADTSPELPGPRLLVQRIEEAFVDLADLAGDLHRTRAGTPAPSP